MSNDHAPYSLDPGNLPPVEERDPDQAWFWTPEWLAGEREADEDIAAGRGETYDNAGSFSASLWANLNEA